MVILVYLTAFWQRNVRVPKVPNIYFRLSEQLFEACPQLLV